jgi:alpha-methylacyl-CoA racemase
MGAEVIRIDRAGSDPTQTERVSGRGKKSVVINLKDPDGVETLLRMVENADVLIDPFRPGVCEKLGLSPQICLDRNPRLVFARMTGWGQEGPLAQAAGHDINYIALTGALFANGEADGPPLPPLNLVGDMGGGGMLLVAGVLAALLETASSGQGQVIDVAMVDGAAQLMWMFHSFQAMGAWDADRRGSNLLDGGAHFYGCYECADGEFVSIGAIEPQFYNRAKWPQMREQLAAVIRQKTRREWCDLMEGSDVCFAPVLRFTEAHEHPAAIAREAYIELDGVRQPAPAPRFSRTVAQVAHGVHAAGEDTEQVLSAMGFAESEIRELKGGGSIA